MRCQEIPDCPHPRRTLRSAHAFCCILFFLFAWHGCAIAAGALAEIAPQRIDSYTLTQRSEKYRVSISYPSVGNPVADAELAIWTREQAARFTESVELIPTPIPVPYELSINYEISSASEDVLSVIFFISTAMGGAHPEPGMATFVYDKRDGRRLTYGDIFLKQDGFLAALSERCRTALSGELGARAVPAMLEAGTEPNVVNFDLFSLTSAGLRIHFPPYQAAPYNAGYLTVFIPLADLEAFKPQLSFWDKK